MLKDTRVRIAIAVVAVVALLVGGYIFYDTIIVSSQIRAAGTGAPVAPTLALKPRSSNTPSAAVPGGFLVSDLQVYVAAQQTTKPYTSCTEDRKATATPTGQTAPAATAAATMAATMAATAQPAAAASDLILFEIVPTESEACYQVGEIFINQNNKFGLAVGVTTAISGQIGIDTKNVANSQVGQIVVDISQLTSDSSSRDGQIRRRWLESNKYTVAKFTPKDITGLTAGAYKEGDTLTFKLIGDLNVHEKDRTTTFAVKAALRDGILYGTAVADVLMTDFGFDPPEIGGILKANNEARIIFNFVAREPKK